MDLTLREAAALLSRSERTLRAQLSRGELRGRKSGRIWLLRSEDLPLTDSSRRELARRADLAHEAVEDSLPGRVRSARQRRRVTEVDAFRLGRRFLEELRSSEVSESTPRIFESGLRELVVALQEFDPGLSQTALRRVRRRWSETLARLLLVGDAAPDGERLATTLEQELLPRLGGLLRWAERRKAKEGAQ
jgi:excisionase family DNA binding protein